MSTNQNILNCCLELNITDYNFNSILSPIGEKESGEFNIQFEWNPTGGLYNEIGAYEGQVCYDEPELCYDIYIECFDSDQFTGWVTYMFVNEEIETLLILSGVGITCDICPIGEWQILPDYDEIFGRGSDFDIISDCVESECVINLTNGEYFTQDLSFINYKGWFFKIDDNITDFYIHDIEILNNELKLIILDSDGTPADIDFCSRFCLIRKKNKIKVSDDILDLLKIGDQISINSICYDNNIFFISSIEQDGITVYSKEYSDLCVNIFSDNLIYLRSQNKYNDEYYYQSVYNNEYLVILWESNKWKHYILSSFFDGINLTNIINGPTSETNDLLNNWNILNGIELSTKYCDFNISENCQGDVCVDYNTNLGSKWIIIDDWKMDKTYNQDDIVLFDDILYIANTQSNLDNPTTIINNKQIKSAPFNSTDWDFYSDDYSIFWDPNKSSYTTSSDFFNNVIYSNGDFYEYIGGTDDFWNPLTAMNSGYGLGETVYYKGKYYYSMTASNHYTIDYSVGFENDILISWRNRNNTLFTPWVATQSNDPSWKLIEIWNPSLSYSNNYVVHKDMVWIGDQNIEPGEEPGISNLWEFKYDILPKIGFNYSQSNNKIIFMNNKYYLSTSFSGVKLDNGIIIYINKKWKNIFINININDDTLLNLSNFDRDSLYNEIYSNLTANNFIQAINDFSNKYEFANYLKYVVIDEDNNITEHSLDKDITKLKHIITAEYPDSFKIRINSLNKNIIENPKILNSTRFLRNSKIDLGKLNWYNGSPLSITIDDNLSEVPLVKNFHNLKNITNLDFYRFSGYYMPIFYDIELFKKAEDFEELGNWIFDDSLSEFGLLKERKIRKVNKKGSILKLRDNNNRSIYPMLDEFGYTTNDFFIFKSNWDFNYYLESNFSSLDFEERIIEDIQIDSNLFGKKVINKKFNI